MFSIEHSNRCYLEDLEMLKLLKFKNNELNSLWNTLNSKNKNIDKVISNIDDSSSLLW